jgi:hypothetical protein
VTERSEKVTAVVGHDHVGAGGPGDFGNMRVIDAAAGDPIVDRGVEQAQTVGGRQVVNAQPTKDFFLEQSRASAGDNRNSAGSRVATE